MPGYTQQYLPHSAVPLIGIDCRFAATHSGLGRYTRELVRALLKRSDPWRYVLFVAKPSGLEDVLPHARCQMSDVRCQIYSLQEQWEMPGVVRRAGVSLMHFPHFSVPLFCPTPFLATIHDLILHKFPNQASLPKRLAYRMLMRNTVKKSVHLIAVSQATANDLADIYGQNVREKLSVIHEGISESFHPVSEEERQRIWLKYLLKIPRSPAFARRATAGRQDSKIPRDFILYIGAAKEHKNVQTLIDACPPDLTLVLVTGGKEVSRLKSRENVHMLSDVPNDDLPALYSVARCLVSPSLAEGFNFPVLEAMACGCPVIATNCGSTPEVAGGFATLVEPTEEGIRKGIEEIRDQERGTKNQEPAQSHARSFTWEKSAEETARIYANALDTQRVERLRI